MLGGYGLRAWGSGNGGMEKRLVADLKSQGHCANVIDWKFLVVLETLIQIPAPGHSSKDVTTLPLRPSLF